MAELIGELYAVIHPSWWPDIRAEIQSRPDIGIVFDPPRTEDGAVARYDGMAIVIGNAEFST